MTELPASRTVQHQTMQSNVECNFPKDHYRRASFIALLDGLLQELQGCFQTKSKYCLQGIFLTPSHFQNFNSEADRVNKFYSGYLSS